MTTPVTIVGAGMAGLLAANLIKVPGRAAIVEAQKSLPNNHSAVLRFRGPEVGNAVGIPFRKVVMIKTALIWQNAVADALAYSRKNNGVARSDRSITDGLVIDERFIAPPDFIARLAKPFAGDIKFGHYFQFDKKAKGQFISTLPMPVLMDLLKYPRRKEAEFKFVNGLNVRAKINNCDAYVTMMVPDPECPFSRISITGNELIVEIPNFNLKDFDKEANKGFLHDLMTHNAEKAAELFGFAPSDLSELSVHQQSYAKIAPIDDDLRKEFIYWATHQHNVFSLGRFATWRPGLLLDHLLRDIDLINSWVNSNNRYAVARHR